jgi:hypothetical protein
VVDEGVQLRQPGISRVAAEPRPARRGGQAGGELIAGDRALCVETAEAAATPAQRAADVGVQRPGVGQRDVRPGRVRGQGGGRGERAGSGPPTRVPGGGGLHLAQGVEGEDSPGTLDVLVPHGGRNGRCVA